MQLSIYLDCNILDDNKAILLLKSFFQLRQALSMVDIVQDT